jgi:hypothetical protein
MMVLPVFIGRNEELDGPRERNSRLLPGDRRIDRSAVTGVLDGVAVVRDVERLHPMGRCLPEQHISPDIIEMLSYLSIEHRPERTDLF